MKKIIFILSLCLSSQAINGQTIESPNEIGTRSSDAEAHKKRSKAFSDSDEIYHVAELQPEFPEGQVAMFNFIKTNLKLVQPDVTCKVIVRFIVEKDGTANNPEVIRGCNETFDAEAIRVAKLFPKLIPAEHNGLIVRYYYLVPFVFRLE